MSDPDSEKGQKPTMTEPQSLTERLNLDEILTAEFEYLGQTAFQANEDRARVATYYWVTVGSLVAAILSSQVESLNDSNVYWAFTALFGILTLASLLTLLQLVRLREAWLDSVSAMNKIKEFYIEKVDEADLGEAFAWRTDTLPRLFKPWSISFLQASQVFLLGSVTLGTAIIFAGLAFGDWWWEAAVVMGGLFLALQIVVYRRLLSR